MTVETILAHVEAAADEPLRERQVPLQDRFPLGLPVECKRLLRPETLPVAFGFVVHLGVGNQCVVLEFLRRGEGAPLLEERFQCFEFAHGADFMPLPKSNTSCEPRPARSVSARASLTRLRPVSAARSPRWAPSSHTRVPSATSASIPRSASQSACVSARRSGNGIA